MAKRQQRIGKKAQGGRHGAARVAEAERKAKMRRKDYEKEMARLQGELVKVQLWLKHSGARVVVVFEGRDAAGKGGVIRRITERVSPRVFRVVALPAPSDREKSQMYIQRYIERFPAGGEIVLFDRSWYNRAGVERVMGFCSDAQYERFLRICPEVERFIVDGGVQLIKYWFEVSQEEQTRRFQDRIEDPRKIWKLSPMDLESHRRWYDYSRAKDAMFAATDTDWAPWHVVDGNDKRRARLNCISHLLSVIPYEDVPFEAMELPKRQKANGYEPPAYDYRRVPERF
ncbi:MAG: polyphosphate kinase 2 [Kiloniellaceae bacterium]